MGRVTATVILTIPFYIFYLVFSGSLSLMDLILGLVAAVFVAAITSTMMVKKAGKLIEVWRWAWSVAYIFYYTLVAEVKAHANVIRRILHPSMPIKPGIVKVPYKLETDYSTVLVANSITNTPGTVVVDLDEKRKVYYVHWIDVKSTDERDASREISEPFSKFARRIFD